VLAILAALTPACRAPGPAVAQQRTIDRVIVRQTPASRSVDVAPPPGAVAEIIQPRAGKAQSRALMTMEQIVASLPEPSFLREGATGPAPDRSEPPLAAQHAYVAAREAWRNGHNAEATRQLQIALRLAPNSPSIHRLLARTNPIRAVFHLRRVLALDPADADAAAALGHKLLDQRRLDEAIVTLAHAQRLVAEEDDGDPMLEAMLDYSLGRALHRQGHDAAAVQQLMRFVSSPIKRSFGSQPDHRLLLARRRTAVLWQTIGDAYNRLDKPAEALDAYQRAVAETGVTDPHAMTGRIAYTCLRLGRPDAARRVVLRRLRSDRAKADDFGLVTYLIRQGVDPEATVGQLQEIYRDKSQSPHIALLIAELLSADKGRAFLRQHMSERPGDRVVLKQLLRAELGDSADPAPPAVAARLLVLAADAIDAAPVASADLASILFDVIPDRSVVIEAVRTLPPLQRDRPAMRLLEAIGLLHLGRNDEARSVLEEAIDADPNMLPVRIELAKVLVGAGEYERAEQLLRKLPSQRDPDVILLHARVLAKTGRHRQAIELLDNAADAEAVGVELTVAKARIQRESNDPLGAEQTLLDALNNSPRDESVYEALFDLYERRLVPDFASQYEQVLQRLFREIPGSRLGLFKRAQIHFARAEYGAAERVLRQLLGQKPADIEATAMLLEVLARADRLEVRITEEVLGWIDTALERRGAEAAQIALLLASVTDSVEPVDEMDRMFAGRIERFPQHEADLRYAWAAACDRRGDRKRSEQMMLDMLAKFPDHAMANNGLGYLWAWRGVNLDQALQMIQRAVDKEPDSAMYLDSLGWVHYKLGNFQQAADWLKKAAEAEHGGDPIIMDHHGDALYRLGKHAEAARWWRQSLSRVRADDAKSADPERKTLRDRLQKKIKALAAKAKVPVSDIPGQPPPKP